MTENLLEEMCKTIVNLIAKVLWQFRTGVVAVAYLSTSGIDPHAAPGLPKLGESPDILKNPRMPAPLRLSTVNTAY